MNINGIKLLLFDNPAADADYYSVLNAVLQGYWTLKLGAEVDAYSGLCKDIAPDRVVERISDTTWSIVYNDRGYVYFDNGMGQPDAFAVTEKTSVWVEFHAYTPSLPASLPDGFRFGISLWTTPKKEINIS